MKAKLLLATALFTTATASMFPFATDAIASVKPSSQVSSAVQSVKTDINFDCGQLSTSQLTELQAQSTSNVLRDLAKRCDEQAEDYELKAKDALQANNQADVSFLREKAANAYLNVAVFTNSSLFKN